MATKVGKRIDSMGLSHAEVAKATGISRPTITRVANGTTSLQPKVAVKLGHALGMDPMKMFMADIERRINEAQEETDLSDVNQLV